MGTAVVPHSDVAPVSRTKKLDSDSLQTPMQKKDEVLNHSLGHLERGFFRKVMHHTVGAAETQA